jgi:glycosidase
MGTIVYQVIVDRFAPSKNVSNKGNFYQPPRTLMRWNETPKKGHYMPEQELWSHELEFWGGDLNSLLDNVDYIHQLGINVLYLNPIHQAFTNHKYDATDYLVISEEYGDKRDLVTLIDAVHTRGMKIVLDGVFNHIGKKASMFQKALKDKKSKYRDWFIFKQNIKGEYRAWQNARNLPELNLENSDVREYLYSGENSVMKHFLKLGIDGWRLDVAHDIGFDILRDITLHMHQINSESLVIGEVWSYPSQWLKSLDGVMNFSLRHLIIQTCQGRIRPQQASSQLNQLIQDSDYERLLTSWLMLDNHDTARLATVLPHKKQRRLAQVLQFTLPGSPNLYYGSELGMTGGDDPEMRSPMDWSKLEEKNATLDWIKKLIAIRQSELALQVGEFKLIHSEHFIAFIRYTDRVSDCCIVVVNLDSIEHTEQLMVPYSKLMNTGEFEELLNEVKISVSISASFINLRLPAHTAVILKPNLAKNNGYTAYKRVR